MALIDLLIGPVSKTSVGVVTLDASVSEKHQKSNEITKFPVEEGKDIADHIRHFADRIEIDGLISDTPLAFFGSAPSPVGTDTGSPVDRAHRADLAFQKAMQTSELVRVVTSLRTYENMAMVDYSVTRDKDNGHVLSFHLALEEVVIAQTGTVELTRSLNPVNSSDQNLGVKAVEAPTKNPNTTVLDDFSHAVVPYGRSAQ